MNNGRIPLKLKVCLPGGTCHITIVDAVCLDTAGDGGTTICDVGGVLVMGDNSCCVNHCGALVGSGVFVMVLIVVLHLWVVVVVPSELCFHQLVADYGMYCII